MSGTRLQIDAQLHDSMSTMSISGLHDIEESIWSPKWGMRGKVDASVQVSIAQQAEQPKRGRKLQTGVAVHSPVSEAPQEMPMPFEIKTGRAVGVMEHRAQTMLYTLLMEERYSESRYLSIHTAIRVTHALFLARNTGQVWIAVLHAERLNAPGTSGPG
jgi:hypothetical protein